MKKTQHRGALEADRRTDETTNILNELPRFPEILGRIGKYLSPGTSMGLVTVHILKPEQFEQRHGAELLDRLVVQTARFLRTFAARAMRHDDEAFETMIAGNAFVILLGPARDRREIRLLDVNGACRRLERALGKHLSDRLPDAAGSGPFACGCTILEAGDQEDRLERNIYAALDEALGDALRRTREGADQDERLLRQILDRNALAVTFQPVVDLDTRQVIGFEALSRPRIETLVPPERLFRIAHRHDALWRLERLARERAIQRARALEPGQLLFLNVDPDTLLDPMLRGPETLFRLREAGIVPSRVVFELTEHRALTNLPVLREALVGFRRMGFRVALDDVGAGHAGLSTIAEVAPDFIKLDLSLVRNMDRNRLKQGLVATVAEFTHQAGITLVAEGVETREELMVLRRVGVRFAQGFLFGTPSEILAEPDLRSLEDLETSGPEEVSGEDPEKDRARMNRGK